MMEVYSGSGWKEALQALPAPAWHARPNSKRDFFNAAWLEFTGRTLEQEMGDGWLAGIHEEDREKYSGLYREAVTSGRSYEAEFRIRHSDGGYRWVVERCAPVLGKASAVEGFVGTMTDITEMRRLKVEVERAYSKARVMGDNLPEAALSLDSEGRVLAWNTAASEMFGYDLYEVLGRRVTILVPERHRQRLLARLAEVCDTAILRGRVRGSEQVKGLRKDGSEVFLEVSYLGTRTEEGATVFAIARDISGLRKDSTKLSLAASMSQAAFESSPAALVVFSPEGQVLKVNDAFCSLLDYAPEQALSLNFTDMTFMDDVELARDDLKALTEGRMRATTSERRLVKPGGGFVWARVRSAAVTDSQGNLQFIVSTVDDVTQMRKSEEELRSEVRRLREELQSKSSELESLSKSLPEAERLMSAGMAVAQAAHDVRNPLTAIDLGLYAIENLSAEKDKDEIARIIVTMRTAIKQANDIISDLNQYVRPKPARKTAMRAKDLVKESLKTLDVPDSVQVVDLIDPGLEVFGDRAELTRVFQNLAKNAIEAMPDGGTLKFWSEQREGYNCICVTDTGKGMPPETLKRLFSPFFTTKEHGLGLGLTVVKRFVEDHGGKVEAESFPGRGTTFKVLLPIQVQQTQSKSEKAQRGQ